MRHKLVTRMLCALVVSWGPVVTATAQEAQHETPSMQPLGCPLSSPYLSKISVTIFPPVLFCEAKNRQTRRPGRYNVSRSALEPSFQIHGRCDEVLHAWFAGDCQRR
jgi:hypothetical protein